jgi:cytochrome P450
MSPRPRFLVTQSEGPVQSYMMEMITERQNSEKVERCDLLSSLLEANTNGLEVKNLTDAELMGTSNPDYQLFITNT